MEDRHIRIFKKSSYFELNSDEKETIIELCSNEEEFQNIKNLYREMESMERGHYTMDSETVKSLLDSEFKEVHGSDRGARIFNFLFPPIVPFYSKPGIQIAFLLVCIISIYFSLQNVSIEPDDGIQYAQNEKENSMEKAKEGLEKNEVEDRSELDINQNPVPESTPAPMEEIVAIDLEEIIMDEEAAHFDRSSRAGGGVAVSESSFEEDVVSASGMFEEDRFDGLISDTDEGRFIIEPVGSHLDLLEDLFVTF